MSDSSEPLRTSRLVSAVWLGLTAAVFVGVAFPYLYLPMAGEQAVISYGAWRLSLGEVLYRDFNCNDAPAIYWIHLWAHQLFGFGMPALRAFDLVWMAATLAVAHRVAVRAFGTLAAGLGVFLAAVSYFSLGYQVTAQKDCFVLLPVLLGVWCAGDLGRSRRETWLRGVAIGALVGLLFWIKPPFALFGAAFVLAVPIRPLGPWIRSGVAMALGFALPAVAWLGYFGAHHAFGPLRECQVLYNLQYTNVRYELVAQLDYLVRHAVTYPVWWVGLAAPLTGRFERRHRLLAAVTVLALAIILFQGKLLAYHLVPLHLLLCLWAGAGVARLWARGWPARVAGALAVAVALASAAQAIRGAPYGRIWSAALSGQPVQVQREEARVASFVARHTRPEDPVLVWGVGPAGIVSFMSKRTVPTRWVMNYPFSALDPDTELLRRWRAEYIESVRRRPPAMVVVVGKDHYPAIGNLDSREALERFPELRDYLARHYRQIQQVEGRASYSFYVRKHAPPEQSP